MSTEIRPFTGVRQLLAATKLPKSPDALAGCFSGIGGVFGFCVKLMDERVSSECISVRINPSQNSGNPLPTDPQVPKHEDRKTVGETSLLILAATTPSALHSWYECRQECSGERSAALLPMECSTTSRMTA